MDNDGRTHDFPAKPEVSLTVTGVVNRNTGVLAFGMQMEEKGAIAAA